MSASSKVQHAHSVSILLKCAAHLVITLYMHVISDTSHCLRENYTWKSQLSVMTTSLCLSPLTTRFHPPESKHSQLKMFLILVFRNVRTSIPVHFSLCTFWQLRLLAVEERPKPATKCSKFGIQKVGSHQIHAPWENQGCHRQFYEMLLQNVSTFNVLVRIKREWHGFELKLLGMNWCLREVVSGPFSYQTFSAIGILNIYFKQKKGAHIYSLTITAFNFNYCRIIHT